MQKAVSPMDNYPIKNTAFGGFNKQDVVRYIEKAATDAAQTQKKREEENSTLRTQLQNANASLYDLQTKLDDLTAEKDALAAALQRETDLREELESMKLAAQRAAQLQ